MFSDSNVEPGLEALDDNISDDFLTRVDSLNEDSTVGPPLQQFTSRAKVICNSRIGEEARKSLRSRQVRPSDCDFLKGQWMNPDIFFILDKRAQQFDKFTLRRQRLLSKAASPIFQVIDKLVTVPNGQSLPFNELNSIKNSLLDSVLSLSILNTYDVDARKRQCLRALGPRYNKYLTNSRNNKRFQEVLPCEALSGREGENLFDSAAMDILKKDLKTSKETQIRILEARQRAQSHNNNNSNPGPSNQFDSKNSFPSLSYPSSQNQGGSQRGRGHGQRGQRGQRNSRGHR